MTSTLAAKAYKAAWTPDSQTLYYSVGDPNVAPNGNTNDVKLCQAAGEQLETRERCSTP